MLLLFSDVAFEYCGHALAAGCQQEGSLEEVRSRIVAAIEPVLP